MEQFIGCDAHKEFSVFVSIDEKGVYGRTVRVGHDREVLRKFLGQLPAGSQIALETSGCYYWMVDAMEQAGHRPRLAHAFTFAETLDLFQTSSEFQEALRLAFQGGTPFHGTDSAFGNRNT